LKDRAANLGSAAEDVDKGNKAVLLVAQDRTGLCGEDAVIGAAREEAAFGLDAEIAVEVSSRAGDSAGINGLILNIEDGAIDRVEVTVASIDIEARGLRWRRRGGLSSLGTCGQS